MKKTLLLTFSIALVYLTSTSYSDGPAEGLKPGDGYRTGGPGSNGTCSDAANGCHSAASASTVVAITIQEEGASAPVTDGKYKPLRKYKVRLTGANATFQNFGFQANVLNSANKKTGWLTAGAGQQVETVNNFELIEHSATIAGTGGSFITEFTWVSPHAGTGNITFYAMVNAVNNDGDEGGDAPSNPYSLTFSENTSASVEKLFKNVTVNMYPNPFTSSLQVSMANAQNGVYMVNAFDLNGKQIFSENVNYTGSNITVNTATWAKGMYLLQIVKDGADKLIPVVKQ